MKLITGNFWFKSDWKFNTNFFHQSWALIRRRQWNLFHAPSDAHPVWHSWLLYPHFLPRKNHDDEVWGSSNQVKNVIYKNADYTPAYEKACLLLFLLLLLPTPHPTAAVASKKNAIHSSSSSIVNESTSEPASAHFFYCHLRYSRLLV